MCFLNVFHAVWTIKRVSTLVIDHYHATLGAYVWRLVYHRQLRLYVEVHQKSNTHESNFVKLRECDYTIPIDVLMKQESAHAYI